MSENIYTPRVCISLLLGDPKQKNKSVCTKIPYRGYTISIAMDSSHGDGDLFRSDILVDNANGDCVTALVFEEFKEQRVIYADADALKRAFAGIDKLVDAASYS